EGPYPYKADPARFKDNFAAVQSIATSGAVNDAGLFEVNFHDDRYLPFEGAGAESTWMLELPKSTNAFDFDTITDVILKVQYTARDGGKTLKALAVAANPIPPAANLVRLFDVRRDFPNEWHLFTHPTDPNATPSSLLLTIGPERFPYLYRNRIA